nr:zinc finger, CCHC-type [Tanacetum cinerariifolium]
MFTRHESKGKYFRGCGRGKHKFSQGHIAPNCPQRTKTNEQSNLVEEDLEPTLLMAILEDSDEGKQVKEVEEQNISLHEEDVGYKEANMDSLWYLDNGASNHMTRVREHFKELDEKVSGKVRFGDGSYIEIKGKGSILIECDDEKQRIISYVYYIPSLKSNVLSIEQFTEIGCKVVMEDDELRLYDMDNKIFMKVTRQRNRLYKANLRIEYMSEHINDELEWTDFKIKNLEVTSEHHDQGTQPSKEDNEFPNNDNDGYASPKTGSPSDSQTPHTPLTSSSQVNSQVTPDISTQSIYQSDSGSTSTTNSHSHFDHTPLRGFRTLNDLYENTEELLLSEDEPKNYKEASSDQKWI